MRKCEKCGRIRDEQYMRPVGATGNWRCLAVSSCKRARLDIRNHAARQQRLEARNNENGLPCHPDDHFWVERTEPFHQNRHFQCTRCYHTREERR